MDISNSVTMSVNYHPLPSRTFAPLVLHNAATMLCKYADGVTKSAVNSALCTNKLTMFGAAYRVHGVEKARWSRSSVQELFTNSARILQTVEKGWSTQGRELVVHSEHTQKSNVEWADVERREFLSKSMLLLIAVSPLPAHAGVDIGTEASYKVYEDADDKYALLVPEDWAKGEGTAPGQRKVTSFFPETDIFTNVSIIITNLGADFTSMGSFGTADGFAETLVNSLDRSWKRPPGQKARLINSRSKNGMYYLEYTIQQPGERQRHIVSAVGIGFNGWYNRLFTITGQFWEDDLDKYESRFEKVTSSFKLL